MNLIKTDTLGNKTIIPLRRHCDKGDSSLLDFSPYEANRICYEVSIPHSQIQKTVEKLVAKFNENNGKDCPFKLQLMWVNKKS